MSYVKISDPAIIDLSGIQQIISVVNQHSDLLDALINRFGTVITPNWNDEEVEGIYDPSAHNIAFGRVTIPANDDNKETVGTKPYYRKTFDYNDVTFSAKPIVLVSLDNSFGDQDNQLDIMLSVYNVTTSQFMVRAARSGFYNNKLTIDNKIQLNWVAIGPR